MSNNLPTAEEFLKNFNEEENNIDKLYYDSYVKKAMIKFAKMHVQEALKQAYQKAELKEQEKGDEQICFMVNDMGDAYVLDKDSILNAYDLNNIK